MSFVNENSLCLAKSSPFKAPCCAEGVRGWVNSAFEFSILEFCEFYFKFKEFVEFLSFFEFLRFSYPPPKSPFAREGGLLFCHFELSQKSKNLLSY
ncbi:hypothetical protein DMC01_07770 [Campylobacter troglodytis]|nr:hypothetical protein DMC01_07770 [Campylobacter troglodytis]